MGKTELLQNVTQQTKIDGTAVHQSSTIEERKIAFNNANLPYTALIAVGNDGGEKEIAKGYFLAFGIDLDKYNTGIVFQVQQKDGQLLNCIWHQGEAKVVDMDFTIPKGCCFTLIEVTEIIVEGVKYRCTSSGNTTERDLLAEHISLEGYVGSPINGITLMSEVLFKYPGAMEFSSYAYYRRGYAFDDLGIYPEAIFNYKNAIRVGGENDPICWRIYFDMAFCKYNLNDFIGFENDFTTACNLSSGGALDLLNDMGNKDMILVAHKALLGEYTEQKGIV